MKTARRFFYTASMSLLLAGTLAQATTYTGMVTNKTTSKPAAGDAVALINVQSGMKEVARATTDAKGHYSLQEAASGSYLVRVTHQGANYFVSASQNGSAGDLSVYDAVAQMDGLSLSADVIEGETEGNQLVVSERYYVQNLSSPAKTLNNPRGIEVVLPGDATLDTASATRPGGLATNIQLQPAKEKGHYLFIFPILPSQGDEHTLLSVRYRLPYSGGKYSFSAHIPLPTDNFAVLLPKSMSFTAGNGMNFKQVQMDAGVLTNIAKNVLPGKAIEFTVSGSGQMPDASSSSSDQQSDSGSTQSSNQAGGGMAAPINTPDPMSKFKGWILGVLAILLAALAAFLLRKPVAAQAEASAAAEKAADPAAASADGGDALLHALKEELFVLESERFSGALSEEEYAEQKQALETVLKRALKRSLSPKF